MVKDQRLAAISARQHGVFTVEQAEQCGHTRRGIEDRERRGMYERLYPHVYAIAGSPASWHRATMAAVLSAGEGAAASHLSAAFLHGLLTGPGPRIHVVTRRWDRVHRSGFRLHESLDLINEDITVVAGIPTTTATRTVVDLGAVAPRRVERALEAGIAANSITLPGVERFVVRVARRGRRGVGVIRPLLEQRRRWDGATASDLEDLFRAVLDRWNVPIGIAQYEINDHAGSLASRPDFAYPEKPLAVELDSEAYHLDRVTFRRDRQKQNKLELLGWRVLRYTWWDLIHRPEQVAMEVKAALGLPA